MTTTIDKAGRIVIPAAVRTKVGFRPGTKIEIVVDDLGVRLVRSVPGPKLVREGKLLIAKPTAPGADPRSVDVARLIEEERNRWPW